MGRRKSNYVRIRYIIFRPNQNDTITFEIENQKFTPTSLQKLEIIKNYQKHGESEDKVNFELPLLKQKQFVIQMFKPFYVDQKASDAKHVLPVLRDKAMFLTQNA